ncbi:hypothetical protein [Streptomyces echinatus]|uniref:hypothetical protein n=1 Tax=Streptomyces echinatus TaxID=67293 RepID=UPI003CD0ADDB
MHRVPGDRALTSNRRTRLPARCCAAAASWNWTPPGEEQLTAMVRGALGTDGAGAGADLIRRFLEL